MLEGGEQAPVGQTGRRPLPGLVWGRLRGRSRALLEGEQVGVRPLRVQAVGLRPGTGAAVL